MEGVMSNRKLTIELPAEASQDQRMIMDALSSHASLLSMIYKLRFKDSEFKPRKEKKPKLIQGLRLLK